MTPSTVTLLGGSRPGRCADVVSAVAELVTGLVDAGHRIRYGGGATGVMGAIADSALTAGGHVHGVIPGFLADTEILHRGLTETSVVDGMSERKHLLLNGADAVIVLPGGIGTLEEFFDVLSSLVLGTTCTRVAIFDSYGFWRPLRELLTALVDEEFAAAAEIDAIPFLTDVAGVLHFLAAPWTPPPSRTHDRSAAGV